MEEAGHWEVSAYWRCSSAYSTVALNGNKVKKIVVNLPNGPKGLLTGSFAEELKPLLPVVFLESERPSDGLKGSELKKLAVELCKRRKQLKNPSKGSNKFTASKFHQKAFFDTRNAFEI